MIRVENSPLPVVALTHPGMKGKNNEDRYGVSAFQTETQPPVPVLLAVLSDGIGGHRAGEVASELAVDVISQYVAESNGSSPTTTLQEAIHLASDTIRQQAQENSEQQGMGATCACAWIAGDQLYTATVGDSRIYLMRGEHITQISIDHTWIQEALEHGLIQPDQVSGHPNAHVIRRYLGSPTPPEVDFRMRIFEEESDAQSIENQGTHLQANDRLLLCSDGLTDLVQAPEILTAFHERTMEDATAYLVDLANQRGGHDNITVVVVQIPPAPVKPVATAPSGAAALSRFALIGCLGAIILGVLAGGVFGGWILLTRNAPTLTPTAQITIPGAITIQPGPILTPTGALTVTKTAAVSAFPTPDANSPVAPQSVPSQTATRLVATTGPTLTTWPTSTASTPLPVVTVISP